MIINGSQRGGPRELALHLQRIDTNETVELLEARGVVSEGVMGALTEFAAVASGSRCREYLYHANINPQRDAGFTVEEFMRSADALEANLKLGGHQRIVVLHRKEGRDHLHVVWNRVDVDTMRSVNMGWDYYQHERTSRQLEREFGLERVQGALAERDGAERPERARPSREVRQEQRTGIKREAVVVVLNEAWNRSDDGRSYATALEAEGWTLARGDRRGFIAIDPQGGAHSLSRFIDGADTKAIARRFEDLDRGSLPTADEVRERQRAEPAAEAEIAAGQGDGSEIAPPAPEAAAPELEPHAAETAQEPQERDTGEQTAEVAQPDRTAQEPAQDGVERPSEGEATLSAECDGAEPAEPSRSDKLKGVSLAELAEEIFDRQDRERAQGKAPEPADNEPPIAPTPHLDWEASREEPDERRRRLLVYAAHPALADRHEKEIHELLTGAMARQWTQQSAQAQKRIDWQAQHDEKLMIERHDSEREELHRAHAEPQRGGLGKLWQGVRKLLTPGKVAAEEQARQQGKAADWRRLDMRQDREKAARAAEVQKQKADERSRLDGLKDLAKRDLSRRQRDEREKVLAGKTLEPNRSRGRADRGDRGKGGWER